MDGRGELAQYLRDTINEATAPRKLLRCHMYIKPQKPEWQGLTDIEIHDCFQNRGSDKLKTRKLIAAAIEAKLREKNT